MLKTKTKDDFIKFVNKTVAKINAHSRFKKSTLDLNAIKNTIMKTIANKDLTSLRLNRFLKLLPKRVLVNVPLLLTAFFELERDGWIEFETQNFLKIITFTGREWIALPTKKTGTNFDIDLALMGVYDDQDLNKTNPLVNEKVCQNQTYREKTIKNLNEKQIEEIDHLNLLQNFFLNEFLKILLAEKKEILDAKTLQKIDDLTEYNEKILHQKLRQSPKTKNLKTVDDKKMEAMIDDCLAGKKSSCPELEGFDKKSQQKLAVKFQNKIHREGIETIIGKIYINHHDLLAFLKG